MQPTVFHMNEGHAAFQAVERIRLLMAEQQLSLEEALEASRTNNVFTTHTPVPAGIDLFDTGLMRQYFEPYCREAGIAFDELMSLGRRNPQDEQEPFSMAIAAIKASAYRNAVSRLHRIVSQQMWEGLWPKLPVWEIPITSITNGVHLPSWINGDFAALYDQYLQPDWREGHAEPKVWEQIADIPDSELWEAHRRRKRRMVAFVRESVIASAVARNASAPEIRRLQDVLDPEALTIGFARRFATYKRATLIFRDLERLKRILTPSHAAGAAGDRRESSSPGHTGQEPDPRNRAILARSGTRRAGGVRGGLLDSGGARAGRRRGHLAQHAAAAEKKPRAPAA